MANFRFRFSHSLITLSVMFFSAFAHADLDVTCIMENCHAEGWQVFDIGTGNSSVAVCNDGDCLQRGWYSEYQGNVVAQVECKGEGCFQQGWLAYDSFGRVLADVTCRASFAENDCLQFGWSTYEPGRGSYETRCVNGDCRNVGWDVFVPGFQRQAARCKEGGCFSTGWILYQ